jgi:hypothetical protein
MEASQQLHSRWDAPNRAAFRSSGRENGLWVGRQHGGLTFIRTSGSFAAKTYTEADGLAQNSVYAV